MINIPSSMVLANVEGWSLTPTRLDAACSTISPEKYRWHIDRTYQCQ
jgi:hypothetical protein